MLINLDELSANDLLELARKKQQQEEAQARMAARASRLAQLRKRREQLSADQERAIAILDKELQALQQRRLQLVASHQRALAALDKEMAEVSAAASDADPGAERTEAKAATPPVASGPTPNGAGPVTAAGTGSAPGMDMAILKLLRGRMDMSDSLLRERLRDQGYDMLKFSKTLDALLREGKVVSKGSGNYALKKRL